MAVVEWDRWTSTRAVAGVVAAMLALVSCGSSPEDGDAASTTRATLAATPSSVDATAVPSSSSTTSTTSTMPTTSTTSTPTTLAPATTAAPSTTAAPAEPPAPAPPTLVDYPVDWMKRIVAASTTGRLGWLDAVTSSESVRAQLRDIASQPLELIGTCEFLVGGQSCTLRSGDGTEWEVAYVAGSAGEGINSVQRVAADPCAAPIIARDLGAGVTVIEGLCLDGWAYVTTGELGDAQFIARHAGGHWQPYVRFPTPMCRSEIVAAGAPLAIVDRVNWQCTGGGTGERPTVDWDGEWRPATGRTVRLGQFGQQVRWLQEALDLRGYSLDVDGYFGYGTEAVVRQFQRDRGLLVDGIAGDEVWGSIGE